MTTVIKGNIITNNGGVGISAPSNMDLVIEDNFFDNNKKGAIEIRDLVRQTFEEIEKANISTSSKFRIKEAFTELIKNPTVQRIKNTAVVLEFLSNSQSAYDTAHKLLKYIQSLNLEI